MILVYIILLFNVVFLKNLTLHNFDNPSANHILDTEIPHDNSDLLINSSCFPLAITFPASIT